MDPRNKPLNILAPATGNTHPLLDYPIEIANDIGSNLSNQDLANVMRVCRGSYFLFTPHFKERKDAMQALQYAAHARKDEVEKLLAMLDKNPGLLLLKSDVISSVDGFRAKNVTIYEFCLLAAIEVKNLVEPYFSNLTNGQKERDKQYAKWAPQIEKLYTQPAYDCSDLLQKIKEAPANVVNALLKTPILPKDHTAYESDLYQAMCKFRKDWAPSVVDGNVPRMHDVMITKDGKVKEFSILRSLQQIDITLFKIEWNNLIVASRTKGDEHERNRVMLVWRQVNGFMQRRLTGEDRCNAVHGLYFRFNEIKNTFNENENYKIRPFERIDKFSRPHSVDGVTHYPETPDDTLLPLNSLGGGFSVEMYFEYGPTEVPCSSLFSLYSYLDACDLPDAPGVALDNLCKAKISSFQRYAPVDNSENSLEVCNFRK